MQVNEYPVRLARGSNQRCYLLNIFRKESVEVPKRTRERNSFDNLMSRLQAEGYSVVPVGRGRVRLGGRFFSDRE
jgi:hypothetical protein